MKKKNRSKRNGSSVSRKNQCDHWWSVLMVSRAGSRDHEKALVELSHHLTSRKRSKLIKAYQMEFPVSCRYLVVEGYILSTNDLQSHFISAAKLCNLYGVNSQHCAFSYHGEHPSLRESKIRHAKEKGIPILRTQHLHHQYSDKARELQQRESPSGQLHRMCKK